MEMQEGCYTCPECGKSCNCSTSEDDRFVVIINNSDGIAFDREMNLCCPECKCALTKDASE